MNGLCCSFFGHREINITKKEIENLKNEIEKLIFCNKVEIFLFGGFGDFDSLCYKIVSNFKKKYSKIKLIYCLEKEDLLDEKKRRNHKYIFNNNYDDFIFLPQKFQSWYRCIYFRNIEMINQSNFCIFYIINKNNSEAYKVYKYAKRKKIKIIEI